MATTGASMEAAMLARSARTSVGPRVAYRARRLAASLVVMAGAVAFAGSPASATTYLAQRHKPHKPPATAPTAPVMTSTTTTMSVAVMPVPAPPPPAPEDNCSKGSWQFLVDGRPAAFSPTGYGVYLWHDPDGGWALRATNATARARLVFSGSLTAVGGQFTQLTAVGAGGADIVYRTADKRTVFFRFVNFGPVDGLNFGTQCGQYLRVNVHIGGKVAAPGEIYLGGNADNPVSNPFKVQRSHPGTAGA